MRIFYDKYVVRILILTLTLFSAFSYAHSKAGKEALKAYLKMEEKKADVHKAQADSNKDFGELPQPKIEH